MVSLGSTLATKAEDHHTLTDCWCLWAHLPHDTDWSIESYQNLYTVRTAEDIIAITESLPETLVKNCMMFLMKEGVKPTWEDPKNREGGCFSYKVNNKHVYTVWKELSYVLVGNTISRDEDFVANVTGITISPKKNFCIIKIWMTNCNNQNAAMIVNEITNLVSTNSIFKKHAPEY